MKSYLGYKSVFLSVAILLVGAPGLFAAKAKDPLDVRAVREKIRSLRSEIESLKSSAQRIASERGLRKDELTRYEREFESQFQKVMVPLLHWPRSNFQVQSGSWLENQHRQFVMLQTRERIAREPLVLIASRELQLKDSESKISDAEILIREAESKHSMLRLQLDELQYLHKRLSRAKMRRK